MNIFGELALTAHARHKAFHHSIATAAAALRVCTTPAITRDSVAPAPPEPEPEHSPEYKELWFSIVDVSANKTLSMLRIKHAVCDVFGVRHDDMISARRQKVILLPRQTAMYLCKELTPSSLPAIGRAFGGRDHSTVLHACRKIARLMLSDAELADTVSHIRTDLEALL